MKDIKIITIISFLSVIFFFQVEGLNRVLAVNVDRLSGRILIQAQQEGQAWYVYPENNKRYYLGRPQEAFNIMRELSLGVKHSFIDNSKVYNNNYRGRILLDVEDFGRAYYVRTDNGKLNYLGRPQEAFNIMRNQGLGISKSDLQTIREGSINIDFIDDNTVNGFKNIEVPFTSQAPFANWENPRLQDACEEASVLMVMQWLKGENMSKIEFKEGIIEISKFLENKYGFYKDSSAQDTLDMIIKDYYNYDKAWVIYDFSLEDIISEIDNNNLVIVPSDGTVLNNPYYSGSGPQRHMLVIKGYDRNAKEFITNDPGTRRGENFRFSFENLYNSIRDYSSGNNQSTLNNKKSMIIISK